MRWSSRDVTGRFQPRWIEDPFDPRGWPPLPDIATIWLDPDNGLRCIVDEVDREWAQQWIWSATPNSTGLKYYATRSTRLSGRTGGQTKIYMHKAILERHVGPAPTPKHTIADHLDGNSLNNRRRNMRWATPRENSLNIHGGFLRQGALSV